jgi:uncharacterized DUF497 family protein
MRITWDEAKRQRTLVERGLDFADVARIWKGLTFTVETYAGNDPVRYKTSDDSMASSSRSSGHHGRRMSAVSSP